MKTIYYKYLLTFFLLFGITIDINSSFNQDALYQKANTFIENKDFKNAAKTYKSIITNSDSLYYQLNQKHITDLRKKYSVQELELDSNRNTNNLLKLLSIIIFFIMIIAFLSFYHLQKKKKKLIIADNKLILSRKLTEASIKNKSTFLSNMSHEIKTPLNAISGFSDVLSTPGIDNDTKKECCDVIKINSELLIKLLNDIVDLSCVDANNIEVNLKK